MYVLTVGKLFHLGWWNTDVFAEKKTIYYAYLHSFYNFCWSLTRSCCVSSVAQQKNETASCLHFPRIICIQLGFLEGLSHGFSNYGSSPHLRSRKVNLGSRTNWLVKSDLKVFELISRKLKVGLQRIYFYFIFRGNTVLHAARCLLGCLPNDNNQASTSNVLLRHHYFNVLTNIDLIEITATRRHARSSQGLG